MAKEEKELCERISQTAALCTQKTLSLCKCFEKVKEAAKKALDTASYSVKRLKAKIGNLQIKVEDESQIAIFNEKQKQVFSELGKEVYYGHKSKKNEAIELESVKALLEQAREFELHKQDIRDELAEQKRKMDEIVIFRKATLNLQNDDPRIRKVAVRVLKRLRNKDAVPYLAKLLDDRDPEVRQRAQETLNHILDDEEQSEQQAFAADREKVNGQE